MKKRGILFAVVGALMACTLAFTAVGCGDGGGVKKEKTIAVVAKGASHAFWQSVKKGADAAGTKYGYKITFVGPESESPKDLPKQIEQVSAAISSNPSALVLATIGEGFVDALTQCYTKHIPVVQFDSGIWANDVKALNDKYMNPIVASVATSNTAAAGLAAEKFFAAIKTEIAAKSAAAPYVIGIIQHDQTQTGIDRAGGFETRMKELIAADSTTAGKAKIEKEVKDGDANDAYKLGLDALKQKGVNAVFMTNEGVVKQVADVVLSTDGKTQFANVKFYGFDAGTKQIQWMKDTTAPKLVGAVAQDSYNIGFKAVEQAVIAIELQKIGISGSDWNASNVKEMIDAGIVYEG